MAARILDLSLEGSRIELAEPKHLPLEALIELAFTVNDLPFRVRARVKTARSDTVFGLHFEDLSVRAQMNLADLTEELAEDPRRRRRLTLVQMR